MAEVFISYRRIAPDKELATAVAQHLEEHGVSYFIDLRIRLANKWVKVLEEELRAAKALVVLISAESICSDMVRQEVTWAHQFGKKIIPVRVDYDGALPLDLGAYLDPIQYTLWEKGRDFRPICEEILAALREKDGIRVESEPTVEEFGRLNAATEGRGSPLPAADPRVETGALKLDSPFYVRRGADDHVERLVKSKGETVLIRGPRQVGKTSLAARGRAAAERNNQRTCYIDFQLLDEAKLRDQGTLLKYLGARMSRDFSTRLKSTEVWDDLVGDSDSLTDFVEQGVLAEAKAPVVLCLDEVDNVFPKPYRDSFFGLLRGWHNRRATHANWDLFNLVIVHSTEPGLFIRDMNQSPFNVGTKVDLGDFQNEQIVLLNQLHGILLKQQELEELRELIGGHPYLVRQAMYALATRKMGMAKLKEEAVEDQGPFGDHLRRHLWVMRDNKELRRSLKQAVDRGGCDSEDDFQRLRAAGLVEGSTREKARARCELYREYFGRHL